MGIKTANELPIKVTETSEEMNKDFGPYFKFVFGVYLACTSTQLVFSLTEYSPEYRFD
jgi:hypothetical protein